MVMQLGMSAEIGQRLLGGQQGQGGPFMGRSLSAAQPHKSFVFSSSFALRFEEERRDPSFNPSKGKVVQPAGRLEIRLCNSEAEFRQQAAGEPALANTKVSNEGVIGTKFLKPNTPTASNGRDVLFQSVAGDFMGQGAPPMSQASL